MQQVWEDVPLPCVSQPGAFFKDACIRHLFLCYTHSLTHSHVHFSFLFIFLCAQRVTLFKHVPHCIVTCVQHRSAYFILMKK